MRQVPRAGIAEPRIPLERRPDVPPKPAVREPAAWSWEVQELAARSAHEVIEGLLDEQGVTGAGIRLRASNEIQERLARGDVALRREVYERVCHVIAVTSPRPGGTSVERAQARLLTWLRIYADYP